MRKDNVQAEWLAAQNKLKEAKRAAGIELGTEYKNQLNKNDAEVELADYRKMIFAIPDLELRRQVIHFSRECHRLCKATTEQGLQELRKRVASGGEGIRRNARWSAIFFGVVTVWVGNEWGVTWALTGAVVSLLNGFDSILRADRDAGRDVAQAKEEIREEEAFFMELGKEGSFSLEEEATGESDGYKYG